MPVTISSFTVTATLEGRCIILLTPLNKCSEFPMCLQSDSVIPPCGVFNQQEKAEEALFSPDNIYFNILCVDSIWTQPLTLSLVPKPGSCPCAAVHPPGYMLTCELLPRLWGPATDPAHWLHRRKEHKTESCPSSLVTPGGVLYFEQQKPASDPNLKASAVVFWVITHKLYH